MTKQYSSRILFGGLIAAMALVACGSSSGTGNSEAILDESSSSANSPNSSSSSSSPLSSAGTSSSARMAGTLTYQGQTYTTVVIGTQRWMAENLNYKPANGNSWCYDNDEKKCAVYGRLYDWTTAMDVAASYNAALLNDSINHQGICPDGWHIPNNSEWFVLEGYVNAHNGDGDSDGSIWDNDAGYSLKATSGWESNGWGSNGNDLFGFSALPSGRCDEADGVCDFLDDFGSWWASTEDGKNFGYTWWIEGSWIGADENTEKKNGYAIRCTQNASPTDAKSTSSSSSAPVVYWNTSIDYGVLVDSRDKQVYRTVEIGNQTWMAQNLNYKTTSGTSLCFNNTESYCSTFGRLYDWATAMGLSTTYNTVKWNGSNENHQGVCPWGWHLPNDDEWTELVNYVELVNGDADGDGTDGRDAAYSLKTAIGWDNSQKRSGNDAFGFSALPAGIAHLFDSGVFTYGSLSEFGQWWSALDDDAEEAYTRWTIYFELVSNDNSKKTFGHSVRCVMNKN